MLNLLLAPETTPTAPAAAPKLPPLETAGPWSMPTDASTFAEGTDSLYLFIVTLDVIFFAIIIAATVWFAWKYRRKSADQKTSSITHNGKIEFLWSAIPAILLVVIFAWAEMDYVKQGTPPQDAINIRVTGHQWFWDVEYPDYPGVRLTSNTEEPVTTLIVPKGKPVRLTITSDDVLHSFYVPAFRVKKDAVPGRYTTMWFEATRVGEFNIFCAEYCGDRHSSMAGVVKVLEPDMFEQALRDAGKLEMEAGESMVAFGERVYKRQGCNACHTTTGVAATGPSWKGLFGKTETMVDGSTVVIDDDYIRESILQPQAKIVAGFTGTNMQSYQGRVDEKQIAALTEYIKTLK